MTATTEIALRADPLFSREAYDHLEMIAGTFASSKLIPAHLQGKLGDVMIALMMARDLEVSPLLVLQHIVVISGKAGWSAQFMIAMATRSGMFKGPIEYTETGSGDSLAVTASAVVAATGRTVSFQVTMAMAKAEGWVTKNPKYRSIPTVMLRYRAAGFLIRLHAPHVMMGLPLDAEIRDGDIVDADVIDAPPAPGSRPAVIDVESTPAPARGMAAAAAALGEEPAPVKPKPWAADPARDAAALQRIVDGRGSLTPDEIKAAFRDAIPGLEVVRTERLRAACEHGVAHEFWTFSGGSMLPKRKDPPAAETDSAPVEGTPEPDGSAAGQSDPPSPITDETRDGVRDAQRNLSMDVVTAIYESCGIADLATATEEQGQDALRKLLDAAGAP